jgi:hypothetical protein
VEEDREVIHDIDGGGARRARVWLAEAPAWAELKPGASVDTYWRNPAPGHVDFPRRAAWGFKIGLGGRGLYGLLGAEFVPHEYSYLRARVDVDESGRPSGDPVFSAASVELPHEYVGGVLAGAVQEPWLTGAGTVHFRWAAVHRVDSSWDVFRILAVGVMRLLTVDTSQAALPANLLPYFGGSRPDAPGRSET